MASEVSMVYDDVQTMANAFGTAGEVLNGINVALEAAIAVLQASALVSFGATEAAAAYLQGIQPHVKRLSDMSNELKTDLQGAIAATRDGDMSGSQRFVV